MSKFLKGALALRKLGRGGLKGLADTMNMGKWAVNVARGFGVNTHGAKPVIKAYKPAQAAQTLAGQGLGYPSTKIPAKPAEAAVYGARSLTGTGKGIQTAGNVGVYGAGAGTLGYNMMKGDGTEPGVDENGIKNPGANEEMVKFREKFQKEKLGGSNTFSSAKYQALRGQSKWVDTAIKSIGAEQYKKMRTALMNGELPPEKMHSFLTDAIAHDTEALKLAGKEAYVLPGVARTAGGEGRVYVMAPMAGKDKKTSYKAMPYGIEQQ